jgi:hypothetical protein
MWSTVGARRGEERGLFLRFARLERCERRGPRDGIEVVELGEVLLVMRSSSVSSLGAERDLSA